MGCDYLKNVEQNACLNFFVTEKRLNRQRVTMIEKNEILDFKQ